jgi:hypothetical protein
MNESRQVEFIPLEWVDRAFWFPSLLVWSRPIDSQYLTPSRRGSDQ